jgi:hypothetical protein
MAKETYPYPLSAMIDRDGIQKLADCTEEQIAYIIKYRMGGFPGVCHRGRNRKCWYLRAEILAWLAVTDIDALYAKRTIGAGRRYEEDSLCRATAAQFITRLSGEALGAILSKYKSGAYAWKSCAR